MTTYTIEEVMKAAKAYFGGDEMAANVWIRKYCLKNKSGELLELTPNDMHIRLAKEFARIEQNYLNSVSEDEIYSLLKDFKYIVPQGSPMYGIGNNYSTTSLSNCFVIGNNDNSDSYGSIFRTDEEQVQLMKRRGGVGHDISHLRPSGTMANNSVLGGLAGATLYMERFSNSTREVAQDGRRGALMLSIDCRHPDTDKFIDMKMEQGKVVGANISVKVTDELMESVINDLDYIQTFPVNLKDDWQERLVHAFVNECEDREYNKLYDLISGVYAKKIKAKELWDKIIKNAHKSAEPGVLFWDTIIRESPSDCYGNGCTTVSTNPCGEIPLPPYDSCRLIAMNLYGYVDQTFTPQAGFDFVKFDHDVKIAQKLNDDLIDLEIEKLNKIISKINSDNEPEDIKRVELNLWNKIKDKAIRLRRTGLGITGEGDMLAALGYQYGSEKAIEFSVEVHRIMAICSYESSIDMAKDRGAFPIWDFEKEQENPFISRVMNEMSSDYQLDYIDYGRRNISNLTCAPTGTTSMMTQTSSGIEPAFKAFYKRRTKVEDKEKVTFVDENGDGWEEYFILHPKFVNWFRINYWDRVSDETYAPFSTPEQFLRSCSEHLLQKFLEDSPYYKATANDIDWKASVTMQGSIQKWIDHSISKTVNLPKGTTVEQVDEVYREAYRAGCKGVTVYVDESRSGVLVSADKKEEEKFEYVNAYKRPTAVECDIYHKTALKQNWMVIIGLVKDKPYEIFAVKDVDNHIFPSKIEKGIITKVKPKTYKLEGVLGGKTYIIQNIVSLMSDDEGVDTRKYSSMLRHRMHPKYIIGQIEEYATIVSFDKVIQLVLRSYLTEEDEVKQDHEVCPDCGHELVFAEGCKHCDNCGYSKCG